MFNQRFVEKLEGQISSEHGALQPHMVIVTAMAAQRRKVTALHIEHALGPSGALWIWDPIRAKSIKRVPRHLRGGPLAQFLLGVFNCCLTGDLPPIPW